MPRGVYIRTAKTKKKMIVKVCEFCGTEYSFKNNGKKHNEKRKFCSYKCKSESQEGKPTWSKGLHPEYLQKENHPSWVGGDLRYWRRQALIRDDYTCRICGFREPEIMVADHILPKSMYPELKSELNNLVTLCPNCHARKTNREKKLHNYKKEDQL